MVTYALHIHKLLFKENRNTGLNIQIEVKKMCSKFQDVMTTSGRNISLTHNFELIQDGRLFKRYFLKLMTPITIKKREIKGNDYIRY